jgi:outer membrane protein TolC
LRQAAESELINAQLRLERLFGVLPGELHHDLGDAAFQLPLVVMPQVVLERELIRARARPEIRYASAQLYRRAADLRVTEAALWPRVTIGGFWGAQDLSVPAVAAANPIWAFSQSASLPILNFGRLQAAVDVADSELQIALLEYQRAVSSALTTTREAAEQYLNQTNQYQQVQEQLAQINQLVRAERLRFKAGMTGEDVPLEQTLAMHRQSIALVLVEISLVSQYARFQKEIGFCGPDESVVNL